MMSWGQTSLQDANSPVMEELIFFHDFVMVILVVIMVSVGAVMVGMVASPWLHQGLLEAQMLECVWTIVPAVVLLKLAAPSLALLYILEDCPVTGLTFKIVGHQWYWSYNFFDSKYTLTTSDFDSFILPEEESVIRMLDSGSRLVLPMGTPVRALVGSADVLHAWTVPALGVKVDACPGRLNQIFLVGLRPGVFFGQCSEICGANHSFMPIVVEYSTYRRFVYWVGKVYRASWEGVIPPAILNTERATMINIYDEIVLPNGGN